MKSLFKIFLISASILSMVSSYEIGPNSFDKTIKSHKLVLVEFWQPNCRGCKMLKPHFNKAKKALGNKVLFVSYNVRNYGDPVSKYQVYTTPTMILFENGQEVDRNYMLGYKDIVTWLNAYIGK